MADQKRFYRELKRSLKKDGNRKRRHFFKQSLRDNPNESHWDEYNFKFDSTVWLNGIDQEKPN